MKDYKIKKLISEKEIERAVEKIAEKVNEDYFDQSVLLICILKGAFVFTAALTQKIKSEVKIEFVRVSSYGNSTMSSGNVKISDLKELNIEGENVIIVEDIIDTGISIKAMKEELIKKNPKSIKVCALLNKEERRKVKIELDYVGFDILNEFVVGYGIDFAEKHRNLPYIGIIEEIKN